MSQSDYLPQELELTASSSLVQAHRVAVTGAEAGIAALLGLEGDLEFRVARIFGLTDEAVADIVAEMGTRAGWFPTVTGFELPIASGRTREASTKLSTPAPQREGSARRDTVALRSRIIPLVPCGDEPTAAQSIRTRLERQFGEKGADQSEQEFRQWVGRSIEEWVKRDFFKRHIQQFKQRPIAWHFVSPERTFEAFVLYDRLSRDTLYKLRTSYAGGLIGRLRAEQARARQAKDARKASDLQVKIEDVDEFRDRIEKIERGDELKYRIRCRWKDEEATGRPGPYAPDIDDGVKVNIRPFQEAGVLAVKEVIKKW